MHRTGIRNEEQARFTSENAESAETLGRTFFRLLGTSARSAVNRFFVYIPHDSCLIFTTVLSNARNAGQTTSPWNFSATIRSKAAHMTNSAAWQNRSGDGSAKTISRGDRASPLWRITIRVGWRRISESLRQDAQSSRSIPLCTPTK